MPIIFAICFILIVSIVIFRNTTKGKGIYGEWLVKGELGRTQENKKYVFHDCRFRQGDKTIQIDHIVISSKGVLVIETKNYTGRIYGDDKQQEWVQVLQYGKTKNKFYSPVKQNASHCYFVKSLLKNNVPIVSIVVFIQDNTEFIKSDNVVDLSKLRRYIKRLPDVIVTDQIVEIAETITKNMDSEITNKEHLQNIKLMKNKIDCNICPRCGSNLVLRKGKYGEFMGCANYPKCKFIKKDY